MLLFFLLSKHLLNFENLLTIVFNFTISNLSQKLVVQNFDINLEKFYFIRFYLSC